MLPIPNSSFVLPLNNPGADWGKAATILGVAAMVIGAVRELWKDHDDLKEMKRKVQQLEEHAAQQAHAAQVQDTHEEPKEGDALHEQAEELKALCAEVRDALRRLNEEQDTEEG